MAHLALFPSFLGVENLTVVRAVGLLGQGPSLFVPCCRSTGSKYLLPVLWYLGIAGLASRFDTVVWCEGGRPKVRGVWALVHGFAGSPGPSGLWVGWHFMGATEVYVISLPFCVWGAS